MATFTRGQRVKMAARGRYVPAGAEGTVVEPWAPAGFYRVIFDLYPSGDADGAWHGPGSDLVPRIDPRAEEFIADMRRFAALHPFRREPLRVLTLAELADVVGSRRR